MDKGIWLGCTIEDSTMFPLVSNELIKELEERYPEKSPRPDERYEDLMWRGGQRQVVNFLKMINEDQASSQLGE